MNFLYVITTAFTVSIDSFIAGFSLSLNSRKNLTLPLVVAATTFVLCALASLVGQVLRLFLQQYVGMFGFAVLLVLGFCALLKHDEPVTLASTTLQEALTIGLGVGFDGAAATFSLVVEGANAFGVPLLFGATHFVAVLAGQRLAQTARVTNGNIVSAIIFFVLAAMRLVP